MITEVVVVDGGCNVQHEHDCIREGYVCILQTVWMTLLHEWQSHDSTDRPEAFSWVTSPCSGSVSLLFYNDDIFFRLYG